MERILLVIILAAGITACALKAPPEAGDIRGEALPNLAVPGQWAAKGGTTGAVAGGWLATFGDRESAVTRVILQNVETVAAGQTTQPDAQGKPQTVPVITLLVTPEEAEDLTLAATQGRIQLALRGALDQKNVRTDGSRVGGLVRGAAPEPVRRVVPESRPRPSSAQRGITYNGAEKSVAEF